MYPRFLQMIFDEKHSAIEREADTLDVKALGPNTFGLMKQSRKGTKLSFQGIKPLEKFRKFLDIGVAPQQLPIHTKVAHQQQPIHTEVGHQQQPIHAEVAEEHVAPPPVEQEPAFEDIFDSDDDDDVPSFEHMEEFFQEMMAPPIVQFKRQWHNPQCQPQHIFNQSRKCCSLQR